MVAMVVVVAVAVVTMGVGSDASAMEMGERLGEASAMVFGSEERRANGETEKEERRFRGEKHNKILLFFYNTVKSIILNIELYCSSIANFFVILLQYNSKHRIALFTLL